MPSSCWFHKTWRERPGVEVLIGDDHQVRRPLCIFVPQSRLVCWYAGMSNTTRLILGPGRSVRLASQLLGSYNASTFRRNIDRMSRVCMARVERCVRPSHGPDDHTAERGNSDFSSRMSRCETSTECTRIKQPALLRLCVSSSMPVDADRRRQVKIRAWISDRRASWNSPYPQTELADQAHDSRRTDLALQASETIGTRPPWDELAITRWRPRVHRCRCV